MTDPADSLHDAAIIVEALRLDWLTLANPKTGQEKRAALKAHVALCTEQLTHIIETLEQHTNTNS